MNTLILFGTLRQVGLSKKNKGLRQILLNLKRNYELTLVSDAPQVWINNVLKELKIKDIFENRIFSGEGNQRKAFGNAFLQIAYKLKFLPASCIVVGDQEDTDIIPAKKLGMHTILVHSSKSSSVADSCIKSIRELPIALEKLNDVFRHKLN